MVSPIEHCNNNTGRPCELCKYGHLDINPEFHEVCTGTKHLVTFTANCKTSKCVYLISCKQCCLQYVGKTVNIIRDRYNGHHGHIIGGTESIVMLHHFTKTHSLADMVIKPIELCADDKSLLEREKYWILQLNTVYPYGLNNRINMKHFHDVYKTVMENKSRAAVYTVFNKVSSKRTARGKGNVVGSRFTPIRCDEEFSSATYVERLLVAINQLDQHLIIKRCRTEIFAMKNTDCKKLFLYLTKNINDGVKVSFDKHEFLTYLLRDLCLHKVQKSFEKKKNVHFMSIYYVNRLMDSINISKIFRTENIAKLFPVNSDAATPTVTFSYGKTIRSKVVNYKETVKDPVYTCNCDSYKERFKVQQYGHVFTGNLDIVENEELRKVLGYGLNYREQQAPDKAKALKEFKIGIDKYVAKVSEKYNIAIQKLTPWKVELTKATETALSKVKSFTYNNILSKNKNLQDLNKLQSDFVLVPVDKASNNLAIICKKYYIETLENELNSDTFEKENITNNDFIRRSNKDLAKFKFKYDKESQSIPFLYWSAKMHKTPPRHRYITSGTYSVLSGLSQTVTKCLKLLVNTARYLDEYKIPGIQNHISIIDNRTDVIKFLNESNQAAARNKSLKSFDFENLYTNIPHDKLKNKLKIFIFRVAELKKSTFISIGNTRAYFTKQRSKNYPSCTKEDLVKWLNYIVDNSVIEYKEELYRQKVGIPMGTSCAPYLANLFLHIYEYEYLKSLVDNGKLDVASKLQNLFRYQDDCLAMNDNNLFKNHYPHIYPKELNLKNTNISPAKSTFLDLTISISRGTFLYKSYDKRNDFNFDVVKFPHLHGKIPRKPSYGVFMSQLHRFCEINRNMKYFCKDVQEMVKVFIEHGFDKTKLKSQYQLFCEKYYYQWSKYGNDIAHAIKF